MLNSLLIFVVAVTSIQCDVIRLKSLPVQEEPSTPPPPPKPYAFGYAAGRFPGNIDRTHSEVSDGSGTVHGTYSYIDPRHRIHTVEYTADATGFHPTLNHNPPPVPVDTPAVAAARERHLRQFANIAAAYRASPGHVVVPYDTAAVEKAKARHFSLYEKIAAEHAQIAAHREAAAEQPNDVEDE